MEIQKDSRRANRLRSDAKVKKSKKFKEKKREDQKPKDEAADQSNNNKSTASMDVTIKKDDRFLGNEYIITTNKNFSLSASYYKQGDSNFTGRLDYFQNSYTSEILDQVVIGLSACRKSDFGISDGIVYGRPQDQPYDVLQLCAGSVCGSYELENVPKLFKNFFLNPNISFVGLGINEIAKKLESDYGIVVANKVELRELASEVMPEYYDFKKGNLTRMAKKVFATNMSLVKGKGSEDELIKYASVEAFIAYSIGYELFRIKYKPYYYHY